MINVNDVLYLYNMHEQPIRSLVDRWDLRIEHTFGVSSIMTVSIPMDIDVYTDMYLQYRGQRYVITDVETDRVSQTHKIEAVTTYIELSSMNLTVTVSNASVQTIAGVLLDGTAWTVGSVVPDLGFHSISMENEAIIRGLRYLATLSETELVFDTINRSVSFVKVDGSDVGFIFQYRNNIKEIQRTIIQPEYTRLTPTGADGLTIESVNGGVPYVEDYSWYIQQGFTEEQARLKFRRDGSFSDERFLYAGNLLREAEKRLEVNAYPKISYNTSVSYLEPTVKIGDFGYVRDEPLGINVNARVVRLVEYERMDQNEVELNYLLPGLSNALSTGGAATSGSTQNRVFVKNGSTVQAGSTYTMLLEANITTATGSTLIGHTYIQYVLAGGSSYLNPEVMILVDGYEIEQGYLDRLPAGTHTSGWTFVLDGLESGSHIIQVFTRVAGGGTISFATGKVQMLLTGDRLSGGSGGTIPRITIIEEVDVLPGINVIDEVSITLTPAPAARSVSVALPLMVEDYGSVKIYVAEINNNNKEITPFSLEYGIIREDGEVDTVTGKGVLDLGLNHVELYEGIGSGDTIENNEIVITYDKEL